MIFVMTNAKKILSISFLVTCVVTVQAGSLEERVAHLERQADNPVLLQLSQRVTEQQLEIQQLYDKVELLQYKIDSAELEQENRNRSIDKRFNKLNKKTVVLDNSSNLKELTKPVVSSLALKKEVNESVKLIKVIPASQLEKSEYKTAFSLMKAKKYKKATNAFLRFKESYPNSSLASNSLYWAGEASLVLKKNSLAYKSFMEVVDLYPSSSKAPDALLRAGDTLRRQGKLDDSEKIYQDILNDYPGSSAVGKAEKRLNDLKRLND